MFYFKNDKQITVIFENGISLVWNKDNPLYDKICELANEKKWIEIQTIGNLNKTILDNNSIFVDGKIRIESNNGHIEIDVKENSGNRVVDFIDLLKKKGVLETRIESIKPFIEKMFQNAYIDAPAELYDFCSNGDFEICEDGDILAYKKVMSNLGSIYDHGKTKHKLWEYTEESNFDTNRSNVCSKGLHFCSHSYLGEYNNTEYDVILVVKVDPRDIVSIPTDCNYAKGRCKKYLPIAIIDSKTFLRDIDFEKLTDGKVRVVRNNEDFLKQYIDDNLSLEEISNKTGCDEDEVKEKIVSELYKKFDSFESIVKWLFFVHRKTISEIAELMDRFENDIEETIQNGGN